MANTHEQLEHAEHVQHAAHDPLDRRVAMSMAIIAAVLAGMTLLSHREHNQTILEQSQATTLHTQASDQWNFFQAKNIRQHEYKAMAVLIGCLAKDAVDEEKARKAREYWETKAKIYEQTDLPKLKKDAEDLVSRAKIHEGKSHFAHRRSNYFDIGELSLELGLVLCSITVLTKRNGFWFSGIAIGVTGLAVGLSAYLLHPEAHDGHVNHEPASQAPETPGKSPTGSSGH